MFSKKKAGAAGDVRKYTQQDIQELAGRINTAFMATDGALPMDRMMLSVIGRLNSYVQDLTPDKLGAMDPKKREAIQTFANEIHKIGYKAHKLRWGVNIHERDKIPLEEYRLNYADGRSEPIMRAKEPLSEDKLNNVLKEVLADYIAEIVQLYAEIRKSKDGNTFLGKFGSTLANDIEKILAGDWIIARTDEEKHRGLEGLCINLPKNIGAKESSESISAHLHIKMLGATWPVVSTTPTMTTDTRAILKSEADIRFVQNRIIERLNGQLAKMPEGTFFKMNTADAELKSEAGSEQSGGRKYSRPQS